MREKKRDGAIDKNKKKEKPTCSLAPKHTDTTLQHFILNSDSGTRECERERERETLHAKQSISPAPQHSHTSWTHPSLLTEWHVSFIKQALAKEPSVRGCPPPRRTATASTPPRGLHSQGRGRQMRGRHGSSRSINNASPIFPQNYAVLMFVRFYNYFFI